ncbi:uncharacterized protein Dwil_GK25009 [Drosophila willistoni]|uniref:Putative ionotropic receptor ligand binding domain-containing protein n=1 Tax=Drosophila willistoni TaxID=7260 RepID=B4NCW5_DROWI|nr:uncharacterized protein LOC6649160 [Drosophila willistoni]EDW82674.1 uncharacterized protein Dwil_GK25009 [Drosophila willistoni]
MWPQTVAHNISLISALVWAINGHFGRSSSLPLTLAQFSSRQANRNYHNDLIDATLSQASSEGKIKFLLDNLSNLEADTDMDTDAETASSLSGIGGLETAIWFIDSLHSYYHLERNLLEASSSYKRNGYFIIVYTGGESGRLVTIREIFKRLFFIYVLNVSVFLLSRQGYVEMYTYFPYGPEVCCSALPVHYATFPPTTMDTILFPNKLRNLYGCELIAVTFENRPFVFIDSDQKLQGIEGMLFNTLADHMNFTIKIIVEMQKERGIVLPNGTATGALKLILDGDANVTFGAYMYNNQRASLMLPSLSYTSFPIVLGIPGGAQISPMQRFIKPFRYIIWSCLLICLLVAFSTIAVIQGFCRTGLRHLLIGAGNRLPCLGLWNTLLGGLTMYPPRGTFARCLLGLWLVHVLILRAAYTGQLYMLLQDAQMRTPLRTLSEVLEKGYTFYMLPALSTTFNNLVPRHRIEVVLSVEKALIRLRDEDDPWIAVPLFLPTANQFDQRSGPTKPHLQLLPEALMTAPLTFYMRPHSYLKRRWDRLLLGLMSGGIVRRFRRINLEKIEHLKKRQNMDPGPLSIWLLSGVFGFFWAMLLLSLAVFLMELASLRCPRLRRIMNAANRYIA